MPFGGPFNSSSRIPTYIAALMTLAAGLTLSGVFNVSNATFTGNVIPTADSTYDIGSNAVRWANGYFDNVDTATISVSGATTGDFTISNATPSLYFKDTQATDGDNNVSQDVNCTDVGSGTEDCDLTIAQQVAGANTTRLTFDADGGTYFSNSNVGISTTSPENLLHVDDNMAGDTFPFQVSNRNASGGAGIQIDRTNSVHAAQLQFSTANTADWYAGVLRRGGSGTSDFFLGTGSDVSSTTPALTVLTGGSVGIGVLAPTAKLEVVAASDADGYALSGYDFLKYNSSTKLHFGGYNGSQWSALGLWTSGSERLTILTGGEVGIGNTSPSALLDVLGAQPTGTYSAVAAGTRMFGHLNADASDAFGTQKGGRITFSGIYTGSTHATYGAIQGKKATAVDGESGGNLQFLTGKNSDGTMNVHMTIDDTGNVGIGTTPSYDLHVYGGSGTATGAAFLADAGQQATVYIGSTSTAIFRPASTTDLYLYAGGASKVAISSTVAMQNDVLLQRDVNAGLTASTTQTQGQGALTAEINEVSTVANANDTVTLTGAAAGICQSIYNNGAQTMQIFPASGDNLGAGVNTATTLASGSNRRYCAYDTTNWEAE